MQVSIKTTDVLVSLLTDHSPILFSCFKNEESNRGTGFGKLNNSLIENDEYVLQMEKIILDTLNELFNEKILDDQVKQEHLKYNIRRYTINVSKKLTKNTNEKIADLETKLKHFKKHCENYVDNIDCKVNLQRKSKRYKN